MIEKKEFYYEILGLERERNATPERIKNAYFHRILEKHSVQELHAITEAYDTLINPEKRKAYDAQNPNPQKQLQPEPPLPAEEYRPEPELNPQSQSVNEKEQIDKPEFEFDFEACKERLKEISNGNGQLTQIQSWMIPNATPALSLVGAPAYVLGKAAVGIYEYVRKFEDGTESKCTLNLSKESATISLNSVSRNDLKAAVELAAAAKWPGLHVPDNIPKDRLDDMKNLCEKYGMSFSTYPAPKPGAKRNEQEDPHQDEEQGNYRTPTPSPSSW